MECKAQGVEEARRSNYLQYAYSHTDGVLRRRYEAAVEAQNEEEAAEAAREYRNRLLDDCDNMLVPDRPNVDVDAWKIYRQALRDVPEQEDFPLAIVWPVKP